MSSIENKSSPIEVWLRQENMAIVCTVVYEDESTQQLDVDSLSMRGAQREMTGWLISNGYQPVGRWESEATGADGDDLVAVETSRRFKQ
ncbi:hypothetical protein JOF29_007953 [Kribbella aluminosa]|uniref:Uncharacterized protein n=1 Tax=Kribbella aluminosa TaxID=416017 RepID=A0ABS4UZ24_9ACTN|nr:hypothetical protein [Kribbella aluminosa]MBP2356843.1 hypothetical protein [Kribbella aluminosa]